MLATYEAVRSPLDLGPSAAQVMARTAVAYVPAAAFVASVDAFREVGGFDETLSVGEDVDLVWRIHLSGRRIRYEPAVTVAHEHRDEWKSFVHRRFDYGTSAALLAARHPGQIAPLAVSGWSALAWTALFTATPVGLVSAVAIATATTALLPKKLTVLADPRGAAIRLAGRGHLGAGRQMGSALWRTYLPVALALTPWVRTIRRTLVLSAVIPNVFDWRDRRPSLDPARYVALRCVDDAAYCAGTWVGSWRERSIRALLPDFTSWPKEASQRSKTLTVFRRRKN